MNPENEPSRPNGDTDPANQTDTQAANDLQPEIIKPASAPTNTDSAAAPLSTQVNASDSAATDNQQDTAQSDTASENTQDTTQTLAANDGLTSTSADPADTSGVKPPVAASLGGSGAALPPKNSHKKALVIWAVALAVLILGTLGFVFGWYIPNQPENVYSSGLERTGEVFDTLIDNFAEEDVRQSFLSSELTGSIKGSGEGFSVEGDINTAYDQNSLDGTLNIKSDIQERQVDLGLSVLTEKAENNQFPDVYFKLAGISSLGLDAFVPGLVQYDDRWISVSSDYIEQNFNNVVKDDSSESKTDETFTADDAVALARTVSSVINEYIFTSNPDTQVFVLDEFIAAEQVEGDVTANRYSVTVNQEHAVAFCNALGEAIANSAEYKKLAGDSAMFEDEDREKCEEETASSLEEQDFEIWVNKRTKLVHKIRAFEKDNPEEYSEFGQSYQGGDIIPFFVNVNAPTDNYRFTGSTTVDFAQRTVSASAEYTSTASDNTNVVITLELKPREGDLTPTPPADAVPIEQIIEELFGAVGSRAADTNIQTDILSVHKQLELFFAMEGYYPDLAALNDTDWRAQNLRGLNEEALSPPAGSVAVFVDTPTETQYAYKPAGCSADQCQSYQLVAQLGDGTEFTQNSLN